MIANDIRKRRGLVRFGIVLAVLTALAACAKEDQREAQRKDPNFQIERMPETDRTLNQTELDSMRAMKTTHRVVRDEYWDLKGGVLANDRLEVWYPGRRIYSIQGMAVLKQMDQAATQINKSFGKLPEEKLVVVCAPNLEAFRTTTGLDWWHYSQIKGDTLSFQTPMTLFMRGLLSSAARQDYSRWALGRMSNGKAPQWVVWGMSAYIANERDVLRGQRKEYATRPFRMEIDAIEKNLKEEKDRVDTRRAIFNAYLMVEQLVQTNGMPAVAAFVLAFGEQESADAAAQSVFSKPYAEVLTQAQAFTEPPVEEPAPAPAPTP